MKKRRRAYSTRACPDRMGRRAMMKRSVFGAAASWTVPSFLGHTISTLDAFAQSAPPAGGSGGPILVVVQMEGGNDGLNMVVPYDVTTPDDPAISLTTTPTQIYYAERPGLAIPGVSVLPLNLSGGGSSGFGLHPAMSNLHDLWTGFSGVEASQLAVINGVGYPNANLSHFTSTDFWNTARPNQLGADGWLGRFFDHVCSGAGGCEPTIGMNLNDRPSLAFQPATTNAGITTSNLRNFGWRDEDYGYQVTDKSMETLYRRMIGVDHPYDDGIDAVSEALAFVQQSAQSAMLSSATIADALEAGNGVFPQATEWAGLADDNYLGDRLYDVAAMIGGGMTTQVYYVSQGGYDTHGDQRDGTGPLTGNHANLLGGLDEAIGAFAAEMKAQGNWDRVLLMTVSEFGRKVIENGSQGTDHGAAAPMLAVGGGVNGGIHGALPSLSAGNRIKNDSLDPTVDFRQVYRTVLENWLGVPTGQLSAVLPSAPADFTPVPFVNSFS
jgi:uncharacterized protein (DUF1501 family)